MPKVQLAERDVVCLVKEVLANKVDLDSMRLVLVDEGEGSEHTCWLLNNALVLRVRTSTDLDEIQQPQQHDELTILQKEGKLKALIKESAFRAHLVKFETVASSIPATIAVGIWQKKNGANCSGCQNVLFSIEERKHGISLDPKPQSTETNFASESRIGPDFTDGLRDLLTLLKMPAVVSGARKLDMPIHESIDLPLLVEQSQNLLTVLITQPSRNGKDETEEYESWQAHLNLNTAWNLCKKISFSVNISSNDLEDPERQNDDVVLLHADLKGEHILKSNGSLSGILDWTDAALGPGFIDIAGLVICVGACCAVQIALQAGHSLHSCSRGVLFARSRCVLYLHQQEGPKWLLMRQARRAFQDAEDVSR